MTESVRPTVGLRSSAWSRSVLRAQDRLIRLLGNTPLGRDELVAATMHRDSSEATSYWLQLVVSVGIATLGLAVGSAAVVIGAMLVAPLMGPIVALAMGLAAGSPVLVMRASGRIALSVLVTVSGAALITLTLPFHELTAEISARTSPTVLDLATAGFCALAAVYAALRPGSATTSTAAGTSIGISLVPPLCASGYGLGTTSWSAAAGAGLLFLTNLVAIVVVGSLAFVLVGFGRVKIAALERTELQSDEQASFSRAVGRRLSRLFESRLGPSLRLLMPAMLLGVIYVPLRRALDEVAWQVRVRAAVDAVLTREPIRVVQSRFRIDRHQIEGVVVVVGKRGDADRARDRLRDELSVVSGVTPRLEVLAVADASAVAGLESSLLAPRPIAVPTKPEPSPNEHLDAVRERVHAAVLSWWPSSTGPSAPLAVDLDTRRGSSLHVRVVHLGEHLSAEALDVVTRAIAKELSRELIVDEVAVPSVPLTRADGDLSFVARVSAAIHDLVGIASLEVCVVRPLLPPRAAGRAQAEAALMTALGPILAQASRVTETEGEEWSVRFSPTGCAPAPGTQP